MRYRAEKASAYTEVQYPNIPPDAYSSPTWHKSASKYFLTNNQNGTTMSNLQSKSDEQDWKSVVIDIILKIITLGLYHVEKHSKK